MLLLAACASQPSTPAPVSPAPAAPPAAGRQNPSPMVENTRVHERVAQRPLAGRRFAIEGVLDKPVEMLVTPAADSSREIELLIHFHGAPWLAMQAAEDSGRPIVVAAVNLGAGGMRYSAAFAEAPVFDELMRRASEGTGSVKKIYLTGFSVGYGAIRSILAEHSDRVDGVLLLDGLHTGYLPEGKVMAEGAVLDATRLLPFLRYAERASRGDRRFVITHSEIFPGTFASTTETTDWLLGRLGVRRAPVMKWGPLGMQQLSEARTGNLTVLGFAGNSAPDHIDHFHGIGTFLQLLVGE